MTITTNNMAFSIIALLVRIKDGGINR